MLSFSRSLEIRRCQLEHDFLVDVIGFLTGISNAREYIKDGKITKICMLELNDASGKFECVLFGEYVDQLQSLIGKPVEGFPVVVIEFAKIKIFRGYPSVQSAMNITRISINPHIPEVEEFKKELGLAAFPTKIRVTSIGPKIKSYNRVDFLHNYPKKTIAELNATIEYGLCVVHARLVGCAEGEDWWYASCVCHKSLSGDSSPYLCKRCAEYVFHIIPRYKVKAMVDDGTDDAIFVLSDADVNRFVKKKCASLVGAAEARNAGFCPCEFEALKDKQLLFIVEKKTSANPNHDGSYKVKGCCNDPGVVDSFLKQVKSRDTAQVDIKDEVLPMEGHPAIHKDEIKELDPVHQ